MRFLILCCAIAVSACSYGNKNNQVEASNVQVLMPSSQEQVMQQDSSKLKENALTVTGTIVFKNLEGGFYGLDGNNGKKYLPHNLAMEYRKNGLVVEVTGTIEKEMMSFKQYGEILKVTSVKVLDASKVKQQNYY